jgi:hypothetical protein
MLSMCIQVFSGISAAAFKDHASTFAPELFCLDLYVGAFTVRRKRSFADTKNRRAPDLQESELCYYRIVD